MSKHEITLYTDEVVYLQSAAITQMEEYGRSWREAFIKYGPGIGDVYLPAIASLRSALRRLEEIVP